MVPKIQIEHSSKSNTFLSWDEIPLEERNGIIESYKIFYWQKGGPVKGTLKTSCVFFIDGSWQKSIMQTFLMSNLLHFSAR